MKGLYCAREILRYVNARAHEYYVRCIGLLSICRNIAVVSTKYHEIQNNNIEKINIKNMQKLIYIIHLLYRERGQGV